MVAMVEAEELVEMEVVPAVVTKPVDRRHKEEEESTEEWKGRKKQGKGEVFEDEEQIRCSISYHSLPPYALTHAFYPPITLQHNNLRKQADPTKRLPKGKKIITPLQPIRTFSRSIQNPPSSFYCGSSSFLGVMSLLIHENI